MVTLKNKHLEILTGGTICCLLVIGVGGAISGIAWAMFNNELKLLNHCVSLTNEALSILNNNNFTDSLDRLNEIFKLISTAEKGKVVDIVIDFKDEKSVFSVFSLLNERMISSIESASSSCEKSKLSTIILLGTLGAIICSCVIVSVLCGIYKYVKRGCKPNDVLNEDIQVSGEDITHVRGSKNSV